MIDFVPDEKAQGQIDFVPDDMPQSNIDFVPDKVTSSPIQVKKETSIDFTPDETNTSFNPTKKELAEYAKDTDSFKNHVDEIYNIPQVSIPQRGVLTNSEGEELQNPYLVGAIKTSQRTYDERFPNRKKGFGGFISNAANDVGDTVKGLAQIVGKGMYNGIGKPLMRMTKGQTPITKDEWNNFVDFNKSGLNTIKSLPKLFQKDENGNNAFRMQYRQDHPQLMGFKDNLVEGLKENYGQKDLDIFNLERVENGEAPINFDTEGFLQSFHAHPLNLLDVVGLGEVGKLKNISKATKGGQVSDFSKTVGNLELAPKYSENLVYNAGQRLLETPAVQKLVNTVDNSPLSGISDTTADFLGLNPDSRLLGAKGAETRLAKLVEQKHQVKNITERNKAIAENKEVFNVLSDDEAETLIRAIESGDHTALNLLAKDNPSILEVKDALKNKVQKNADFYIKEGLLGADTARELPINTYASIKHNKPISALTEEEKLNALKEIDALPENQRPFYVPMMFEDNLRAGDFFASTTKRYNPNELRQRNMGMGLGKNSRGANRVYNPVELANRLDAHRIKMQNTENMINEVLQDFAKPYDLSKDQLLEGYVPFNPDTFLKFYRKAIDMNELTLRKLDEMNNVDSALKSSIEEAIRTLPDDILELTAATKNNKIYQIPESVADSLTAGKSKKGLIEACIDMGTAGFKRKVLGLSPKWFINNRIGNGIMAGLKGVGLDDYIKALKVSDDLLPEALRAKSMYEAEKTIIGRTGGGNNSTFGNTMRLLGGEFINTKDLQGLKKLGISSANLLGIPGKVINKVTDAMFSFNQKFENWERKAAYLHSADNVGKKMLKTAGQNITKQDELLKGVLDNEKALETVMKDVDNTLGDYINMTSTERRVIRKIVPFYSWFRTITRYTLSLAETNPIRANLANKISMILNEQDEKLPEYQRGSIPTEFVSDRTGKPLRLNYEHSIPFSTFGETADNPIGLINPLITQPAEALRGRREFMNRPFVSREYENVFPNGYASLDRENLGEFYNELPLSERLKAFPIGLARTSIPGLEWTERVGAGTLKNLFGNGEFKPYDALYDTSLGGYNYNDGFSKIPKGWSNREQLLRVLLPLQQEGKAKEKVKIKRKAL